MTARRPRLYRLGLLFARLGLVATIAVLLYLAIAVYSASQITVRSVSQPTAEVTGTNSITVSAGIDFVNGGFLPVSNVGLTTFVWLPTGQLIGEGRSPLITVPGSSIATIPLNFTVPLSATSAALTLLTHSLTLPSHTWANATFAYVISIHLDDASSVTWGAPFDGLNITAGPPNSTGNGSVTVAVHLAYTNHAPLTELGTLTFTVFPASGPSCGQGSWPINAPQGTPVSETATVDLSPSCSLAGGHIASTYTGNGLSLALPSQAIP